MELIKWLTIFLGLPFVYAFRDRIIGGQECPDTKHPFLALLYDDNGPFCGATLIKNDWVITAAHCYRSEEIQVKFGVHNLLLATEHEQVRVGKHKICYNTEDCANFSDDIMLIQLDSPVEYSEDYVCPLNLTTDCLSVGTNCIVMGWGAITESGDTYPEVPHCVNVTVISQALCEDVYGSLVNENTVCVGDMDGGKGSCQGDSGGPLICDGKLQGVVSFGSDPCAEPDQPGVYALVCKYLDWIRAETGEDPFNSSGC